MRLISSEILRLKKGENMTKERNENFDAGCYEMPEQNVIKGIGWGPLLSVIFWMLIIYLCSLPLVGCTNWQGGGIRIGWENYNSAKEVKEYTQEKK